MSFVLRVALILPFMGLGSMAWSATPYWWCGLQGEIQANPNHFFTYGRDSWHGEANIECRSLRGKVSKTMNVTFNSLAGGVGTATNVAMKFNLIIWTVIDPDQLKLQSTLFGVSEGSLVHWQFRSEKTEFAGSAWLSPKPMALPSLKQGTLYVRPSGEVTAQ